MIMLMQIDFFDFFNYCFELLDFLYHIKTKKILFKI